MSDRNRGRERVSKGDRERERERGWESKRERGRSREKKRKIDLRVFQINSFTMRRQERE